MSNKQFNDDTQSELKEYQTHSSFQDNLKKELVNVKWKLDLAGKHLNMHGEAYGGLNNSSTM